ncbi:hypothetical protein ACETRX_03940 [Labrys portucalensis]|uniref:PilZ domain-containing protein n=1 Tax=Labrys neptuniae TaxID=376174 RepID=A0ABV6Z977_9HYPH
MDWTAQTNFRVIEPGTVLALMVTMQISGEPEPQLSEGDTITFQLALAPGGRGTVLSANQSGCDFTLNGVTWRITPRRADELGSGIATGLQFRDWIVRQRIGE